MIKLYCKSCGTNQDIDVYVMTIKLKKKDGTPYNRYYYKGKCSVCNKKYHQGVKFENIDPKLKTRQPEKVIVSDPQQPTEIYKGTKVTNRDGNFEVVKVKKYKKKTVFNKISDVYKRVSGSFSR